MGSLRPRIKVFRVWFSGRFIWAQGLGQMFVVRSLSLKVRENLEPMVSSRSAVYVAM